MDKNGQQRGGARRGSGRKPKTTIPFEVLPAAEGIDRKDLPSYMRRNQRPGESKLLAPEIYADVMAWLKDHKVDGHVTEHAIEIYSMSLARWIQAEEAISRTGFLAKHPTTGAPIASPYVAIANDYQKQTQAAWFTIYQMIKDATDGKEKPEEPTNSLLDLLRNREAK